MVGVQLYDLIGKVDKTAAAGEDFLSPLRDNAGIVLYRFYCSFLPLSYRSYPLTPLYSSFSNNTNSSSCSKLSKNSSNSLNYSSNSNSSNWLHALAWARAWVVRVLWEGAMG